jgi:hypothetical protein
MDKKEKRQDGGDENATTSAEAREIPSRRKNPYKNEFSTIPLVAAFSKKQ